MDKEKLNSLRRMAGLPQDFSATRKKPLTEDDEIGQVLRGGKHKFYLVTPAEKNSKLADVLTEVDFRSLVNIIKNAKDTNDWELLPPGSKNEALNLARKRLATIGETVGDGAWARNPINTPHPTNDDLEKLEQEETDFDDWEDEWEPSTNICPECEGGEHPPAHGVCERCGGLGEIYESEHKCACGCKPAECKCGPECKCGCNAKEEQEEKVDSPPKRDVVDWSDVLEAGKKTAKEVHGSVDKKKLDGIIDNAKKHKPDSTAAAVELVKNMLRGKEEEEEVKPDFADIDKDGDKKEPAKKAAKEKKEKVKESMHYHTDDKYNTFADDESSAINAVGDETVHDHIDDVADDQAPEDYRMANDTTSIKVPSKVLSELKRVIDETTAEAERAKPRDYERAHYYEATAEALQIVHDFLSEKTVEGLKQAQLYIHKMANVSQKLIPDYVWKFVVDGGSKRSLKSYMNDVKDPVTGKPFDTVDVKTLNKNTHTQ